MLPSIAFMYMEDWTYDESLYYTFITLSTIGFGDYIGGVYFISLFLPIIIRVKSIEYLLSRRRLQFLIEREKDHQTIRCRWLVYFKISSFITRHFQNKMMLKITQKKHPRTKRIELKLWNIYLFILFLFIYIDSLQNQAHI